MMPNTGTTGDIIKLRSGSRTLPLPGKKKLIIQWGELHKTSADLLVNATHTAPKPSGKTIDGLKQEAGASFDMAGTCEKAFNDYYQNGIIPDGAMVITDAGRIQNVKMIMHLKIPQKWEASNGRKNLEEKIINCLNEANRLQMTTMAFPTIGTADCSYPGDEVATTFIRSISKFMWEQKSCSLKKIYVVIYKSDIITTSAFECIIKKIFSMRPHRLVADIEETLEEEHKEGENDKTKNPEQNVQIRPPSPVRREPSIYQDKGRQKSQVQGSFNVNATSSAVVELEIGKIENSKADVIVCSTASFPKLHGAIAEAIVKTGGKSLQDECKTKYQTYPNNGVASSGPGKLNCKEVFYVVLSDYNSNNGKDIYGSVFRCLEQAENNQMKSIAMPTFGTGGFKFPDQISASQTFEAITDFFQIKRQYLSMIVIVMFGPIQHTCQEFQKEAQRVFTSMVAPAPMRTSDTVHKGPKSSSDAVQLQWKIPNSFITLEITKGNIELAKADVILNTTSSYPKLNGIIPSSLSKAAGPQLQQECLTFNGNVTNGMIEETSGYNLNCSKVYHYVMPEWKHGTGEKMIMNCIDDCLYKMKTSGLTTVAIPAIGTGGMRFEPALVARGIYSAVADFGSKNKDTHCNINVVLFPAATAVNQTFVDELQQFMKDNGSGGKQEKQEKGVQFSAPSGGQNGDYYNDDSIEIPTRKRDFVLFELTSDDPKTVEATFKKITDQIEKETKAPTIELKKDNHIDDLGLIKQGKKNKKFLERIGEMYRVNVTIDEKSRKIMVKGLGANVIKCFERITKFMQDLREQYVSKNLGSIVYQNVEWYYTEDNGCIYVPYPKHITYRLEDAFASQSIETEFRDIDDKTYYVVDFNKMEEYVKGETNSKTVVGVIRKDTAEGAAHTLPGHWTPMKNENLEEVILKPTDQDYKDTETSFKASIGAFKISQIKEIRRIQNKTVYQQYQTKKGELDSKLNNMPNLERTLWHGTKEDTGKSIISNGFNRSYAGATHNTVWYGMGVYFTVKSEYSTDNQYSPPDNAGWKRVFLAKVLTGQTTPVAKGYNNRYAPNLPGSNIDRYHSTCDDQANPTVFVIYNDIQAYPEYLIIFK